MFDSSNCHSSFIDVGENAIYNKVKVQLVGGSSFPNKLEGTQTKTVTSCDNACVTNIMLARTDRAFTGS